MDANKIIDALGGTCAVADMCEVSSGAVSQWRTNGIPEARIMFLKLAKPDVFARIDSGESATDQKQAA